MTLENCKRLFEHYKGLVENHSDPEVKRHAKIRMEEMRVRIERKSGKPVEEPKPVKGKKDGKK